MKVSGTWDAAEKTDFGKNVVALLPGTGPLAEEYIVVGGHYDHLGHGEYGSRTGAKVTHFGADDNASGTATVLALARMLEQRGPTPGRSVLFVLFSAEEIGLVGSREFVADLPVDKHKIVAMLNYDMLGRPTNRVLQVGGIHTSLTFEALLNATVLPAGLQWQDAGPAMENRSDHASFDKVGVPTLFFFGALHADYHTERDTPDKLDYDFLARATYAGFDILQALRTVETVPAYRTAEQRVADAAAQTKPTRGN